MEATAMRRNGSPGPSSSSWTYQRLEQMVCAGNYTVSSGSRSGTIVSSTVYTSGASRSSLSTDLEFKILGYEHLSWHQRTKEEKMKRVVELPNGGVKGWFTELEVTWVLDLEDGTFVREIKRTGRPWGWIGSHAPTWIHALAEIVATIHFTQTHAVPHQFFLRKVTSKLLQRVKSKLFFTNEAVTDDLVSIPAEQQVQIARFTQEAMLKLLAFVDVLVAVDPFNVYRSYGIPELHKSLNILLGVHGVLFKALHVIVVLRNTSRPGEGERILGEIFSLLLTKQEKALTEVCLTLNQTTLHLFRWTDDSSATQTLQQGSSDIHEVTRSVISHISFLMDNKLSLDLIMSEADNCGEVYQTRIGDLTHIDSVIIRMASHLQENLAAMSETFPNQGLRFLFLLNNSHQLHQCLRSAEPGRSSHFQLYVESHFVDDYMQSYLQVSWAPVLSYLLSPTPRFLGYSPLTRFESEFQETYITQKHWKVPDPVVRKNLRTAIIHQIIPGYTKYIEEKNITTPRLAPQELEQMLQDLFEG